jgi:hypothetical protein
MQRRTKLPATSPILREAIETRIYLIRGLRVMRDTDLAKLYDVQTFNLNKAVRRNLDRFPEDFMFQITKEEAKALTFQIGMSKPAGKGGRRTLPYVFTEQGVAMLSTVLNSDRAIKVNIAIMRAFVSLRKLASTHRDHAARIDALERHFRSHDATIKEVFRAIRTLMKPDPPARRIGFSSRKSE